MSIETGAQDGQDAKGMGVKMVQGILWGHYANGLREIMKYAAKKKYYRGCEKMGILHARNLHKYYGGNEVLSGVNLTVSTGRVHGLVGHNGAGKSTLLRLLVGVEAPDKGDLLLNDEVVHFNSPHDAHKKAITAVYQELRVIPEMTVTQNIFLGQEKYQGIFINKKEMENETEEILGRYGLDLPARTLAKNLTHAQRQLLEIVSALHRNASFLFLDEPTTSLAANQIETLLNTLKQIAGKHDVGITLVSHKLNEIYSIADEIFVLCNGELVLSGNTREISFGNALRHIVGIDKIPAVKDEKRNTKPSDDYFEEMLGASKKEPPVFSSVNITGDVIKNISISASKGEIFGLYGLVGSGRTNFLRTIYGIEKIKSGTFFVNGEAYLPRNPSDAIRYGIAYLTEDRRSDGYVPDLNCIDNSALPIFPKFSWAGFIKRRKINWICRDELGRLEVRGYIDRPVKFLSGGNQQKVLFARASLQEPKLLLLDEPTKGIDMGVREEIYAIIEEWAVKRHMSILLVSSEEEELLRLCHRIGIFIDGQCIKVINNNGEFGITDLRDFSNNFTSNGVASNEI